MKRQDGVWVALVIASAVAAFEAFYLATQAIGNGRCGTALMPLLMAYGGCAPFVHSRQIQAAGTLLIAMVLGYVAYRRQKNPRA